MDYNDWFYKHHVRYYKEPILVFSDRLPCWDANTRWKMDSGTVTDYALQHKDDPFWADLLVLCVTIRMGERNDT